MIGYLIKEMESRLESSKDLQNNGLRKKKGKKRNHLFDSNSGNNKNSVVMIIFQCNKKKP